MRVVLCLDNVKAFVCFEAAVVLISYLLGLDRQHIVLNIQVVGVFAQALFEICGRRCEILSDNDLALHDTSSPISVHVICTADLPSCPFTRSYRKSQGD